MTSATRLQPDDGEPMNRTDAMREATLGHGREPIGAVVSGTERASTSSIDGRPERSA